MIYPEHLQIETVAGICSAKCIMCPIDTSPRKKIMSDSFFFKIIDAYKDIKQHLEFTTLHGLGEPLLDKNIANKVRYAKQNGFPSVGFATNATHLTQEIGRHLLEAQLDTIIFSIDGINKETHEAIRINVNFENVIKNVLDFIQLRNKMGKTKIIIRMIKQDLNKDQWDKYFSYWGNKLNSNFGDQVSNFDVHNWGGKDFNLAKELKELSSRTVIKCTDLYERMFIYVNGEVGLCCGDDKGWFNHGNVLEESPLEIYNRGIFKKYRLAMEEGNISNLEHCNNCSIIFSRVDKKYCNIK